MSLAFHHVYSLRQQDVVPPQAQESLGLEACPFLP